MQNCPRNSPGEFLYGNFCLATFKYFYSYFDVGFFEGVTRSMLAVCLEGFHIVLNSAVAGTPWPPLHWLCFTVVGS